MQNAERGTQNGKQAGRGAQPRGTPFSLVLFSFWLLASAFCISAYGQRDARVPDPDPELERRSFQVADGFEVNLFAADPLLAKPIQMNFDAAGRLWVASSEAYPQIKPGQKADDKILVLEDRDGDGRADHTTVFAGGLLIPTGLEPGDGGVYVAASTDLLHLADTDGDGKADRRRVVLSGFGTEDTHHMVHTLRWGPDGMLYFNQSIYIHSHLETPHGPRHLNAGGIWQLRPETLQLDVFARGWVNAWGHHFDRFGQSFVTDGAGGEGVNYVVPGASYTTAAGASRLLHGLNPGSPKYCGCEILSGRHLPEAWRGNLVTNDFRGHRVCRFVLSPDGAGYQSREMPELIKTNHAAFRPVDVKMGPDGAIYVADWYNPIIQHGEVDFRDPRRDLTHGRIWRVTAKGRPLVPRPRLVGAKTEDLLEALKAPEDWTRHFARRVLKERGASVLPDLAAWVARLDPSRPENEPVLLEGLWTYQALDVVEPKLLTTLLEAHEGRVRAAAARFAGAWHARLPDPLGLLGPRATDEHPQVRLEAVRALGRIPSVRAAELALAAHDRPLDKFLDYALWLTSRELAPQWMPAVEQGKFDFGGKFGRLLFALKAAGSREAVRPLVRFLHAGKVPPEREDDVFTLLAAEGEPAELGLLLDRALAAGANPEQLVRLLTLLEQAAQRRNLRPAGDLGRFLPLLRGGREPLRAVAFRLAGRWALEAARPELLSAARSPTTSASLRQAAVEGLAALGGQASRDALDQLAAGGPSETRRLALAGLAGLDLAAAARRAADLLARPEGAADPVPVLEPFLRRKKGPEALAGALAGRKLPADVAKLGVRAVRSSGRDEPALLEALTKAGGLTSGPRALTAEEMRQTVADVARLGDPARGEAVFRRADQTCLKCHAIAGAGGQVGPDLSSVGASAQVDYLIDSLLQPSKAIKENYHAMLVTTRKGLSHTGIKVRETPALLVLRDAEDKEIEIPTADIDDREMLKNSLMPDGLSDTLTRGELLDLVRFLSELGKVGPYAAGQARLVRRWEALAAPPRADKLLATGPAGSLSEGQRLAWAPAYSTVAGVLPLDELPRLAAGKGAHPTSVVRCQLDVSAGGPVALRINGVKGLSLRLGRQPVALQERTELLLTPGRHTLTFAIDRHQRRAGLRCEVEDVPGSPARVQLVGGK